MNQPTDKTNSAQKSVYQLVNLTEIEFKQKVEKILELLGDQENIEIENKIRVFLDLKYYLQYLGTCDLSGDIMEKHKKLIQLFRDMRLTIDLGPAIGHNVVNPITRIDHHFGKMYNTDDYDDTLHSYSEEEIKAIIEKALHTLEHAFLIFLIDNTQDSKRNIKETFEEFDIGTLVKDVIFIQQAYLRDEKPISCKSLSNLIREGEVITSQNKSFFINLFHNIIKNASENGEATQIEFSSENGYIFIKDNGKGINTEKFSDPNEILKKGVTESGSGIGLSYFEEFGIECTVSNRGLDSQTSPTGKGACFKIKL